MITSDDEKAKLLKLDCKISGISFSCVIGELELSDGVKIMAGKFGKPALGLNISCALSSDIELKMYQTFCKPLFKSGMENIRSQDPDFDRRYYMLTRNVASAQQLASNQGFQVAAKAILDKHPSLTIKGSRLIFIGMLSAVAKNAGEMKALMVSMAKLATVINTFSARSGVAATS